MATVEQKKPRNGKANLVEQLAQVLRDRVLSGELTVGAKLPSEAELTAAHGVSRTVVREAIAALRADGLVESRQGAGVFVVRQSLEGRSILQYYDMNKISSVIEMQELRAAVEIEAAGLAAQRRSPAQESAILEAAQDMRRLVEQGAETADSDLTFHRAVAAATNNPKFIEFLELLAGGAIPRQQLSSSDQQSVALGYFRRIAEDHARIARAISDQNAQAARDAMRSHLGEGVQRYRDLLR